MHFGVLVLVDDASEDGLQEALATMCQHGDRFSDEHAFSWDWFMVGGRWTGWLSGYDPEKDPNNWVRCAGCNGTGTRTDGRCGPGECNYCGGVNGGRMGADLKWPTEWRRDDGDILTREAALRIIDSDPDNKLPYAVTDGRQSIARERWDGQAWNVVAQYRDLALEMLRSSAHQYVVVVDCHS